MEKITRQMIADELGISRKTLYRWLKAEGITAKKSQGFTRTELRKVYRLFYPETVVKEKMTSLTNWQLRLRSNGSR